MITREQLRDMLAAKPFKPFLVVTAGGDEFQVRNPLNAACSVDGREMTVFDDRGMHALDMRDAGIRRAGPRYDGPRIPMTVEVLRGAMRARPFRPFAIRTADGREFRIVHEDAVAWDHDDPRVAHCFAEGGRMALADIGPSTVIIFADGGD